MRSDGELAAALRRLRQGGAVTALLVGATALAVAALVLLTAVFGALGRLALDRALSAQAHVVVRPPERPPRILPLPAGQAAAVLVAHAPQRPRAIDGWRELAASLRRLPAVAAVAPTASGSALAVRGQASCAAALRGVEPASFDAVMAAGRRVKEGRYALAGAEALVGVGLAQELGLGVGDRVRLVTEPGSEALFTVAGTLDLGSRDANVRSVIVPLHAAQALLGLPGGATSLELRVNDAFAAEAVAQEVARSTGLDAESWRKLDPQLVAALRAQDWAIRAIQALVALVMALGMGVVLGASRRLGPPRASSAAPRRPAAWRVLLLQGALAGLGGAVLGGALAAAAAGLAALARRPEGALVPLYLRPGLFALAAAVAVGAGVVAALATSLHAARVRSRAQGVEAADG